MATAFALIVMPRSRSSGLESRCCAWMSRCATVFVSSRMRSASVDFPWSMWATMQKLRIFSVSMSGANLSGGPEGGAEPAGVVAGDLGRLDADVLEVPGVDAAAQAGADLFEEEVAGESHPARQDA